MIKISPGDYSDFLIKEEQVRASDQFLNELECSNGVKFTSIELRIKYDLYMDGSMEFEYEQYTNKLGERFRTIYYHIVGYSGLS